MYDKLSMQYDLSCLIQYNIIYFILTYMMSIKYIITSNY